MLYCDVICYSLLVARVKQNILITALTINEFSNCLGICLHVVFSTDMFTSNITEDQAFKMKGYLQYQSVNNNTNILLVLLCIY